MSAAKAVWTITAAGAMSELGIHERPIEGKQRLRPRHHVVHRDDEWCAVPRPPPEKCTRGVRQVKVR